MGARKEVFISATSADLGSYRQVAKEAVLTLGAHPIEEKNFPTDYRELQALLARRLDPCDAIVHLVGFYYGGEPKAPPDTPRRSWTQWEYYRATFGERPKPVYRFLAREDCHFDAQPTEDAEKQRLQREHRESLKKPGGPIYYEFSTPQELRERILSINDLRGSIKELEDLHKNGEMLDPAVLDKLIKAIAEQRSAPDNVPQMREAVAHVLAMLRSKSALYADLDNEIWGAVFASLRILRDCLAATRGKLGVNGPRSVLALLDLMVEAARGYLGKHEASYIRFMQSERQDLVPAHREGKWPELHDAASA